MEQLIAKARTMTADQIIAAATMIGPGCLPVDQMMVRAALIDAYAEKEGKEAADTLMDFIGM